MYPQTDPQNPGIEFENWKFKFKKLDKMTSLIGRFMRDLPYLREGFIPQKEGGE